MRFFGRQPLFNEAGDATSGGASTGNSTAGNAGNQPVNFLDAALGGELAQPSPSPSQAPAPQVPIAQLGGQSAPQANIAQLVQQAVEAALAKQAPQAPEQPQPPKGEEMPAWAAQLADAVQALQQERTQAAVEAKRQALTSAVLSKVPEKNRKLGEAVLRGLLAGQQFDQHVDVQQLAANYSAALQANYPDLFQGGSSFATVQTGPNGQIDWSGIRTWDDVRTKVPPHLVREIPKSVTDRIRSGVAGNDQPNAIPRNIF